MEERIEKVEEELQVPLLQTNPQVFLASLLFMLLFIPLFVAVHGVCWDSSLQIRLALSGLWRCASTCPQAHSSLDTT